MLKKAVWAVTIAVALVAGAHLQASDAMKAIVGSYLDIQARLAADKTDGVKASAQAIGEQAARMGAPGEAIVKSAKEVADAADLKAARLAFGDLSDAVIAAGKAEGWKDTPDVKVAYCPMVKKSWLQKESEIRNPSYGSAMLTCGSFTK
jgi:hypothetical protein